MKRSAGLALGIAMLVPLVTAPMASAAPLPDEPAPAAPTDLVATALGVSDAPQTPSARPGPAWTMTQYRRQRVAWSSKNCTAATKELVEAVEGAVKTECATIRTPLNWKNLSQGSMKLHVTRVKRSAPTTKATRAQTRTLFVNPGGPGGAAGPMTVQVALIKPALRTTHEIIGVDPRGTGGSTPLPCMPHVSVVKDSRFMTSKVRAAEQAAMKESITDCVKKHGTYLPHITTANTVSDHDLVRQVLGRPADWYGVSGGSWMGAWYAHLYPRSLQRVVLDANTQFTADWRTSFAHLPAGFQRRFERMFLPWAARKNADYGMGTTTARAKASYERVRAAAGKGKVTGMTPNDLDALLMLLMYDDELFPFAAYLIGGTDAQLTEEGTAEPALPMELIEALGETDLSMPTVRTAIICNDTAYPRTPASFEAELARTTKNAPLTAGTFQSVLAPCAYWPYKPAPAPRIDGSRGPMKLMVQTELDPATPIEGALRAHAADRRTRLLTVNDQGSHGGYLTANTCVDTIVTDYLATGTMPRKDVTCAGIPLPDETKVYSYTTKVTPKAS